MSDEPTRITEKGMQAALEILNRTGYLDSTAKRQIVFASGTLQGMGFLKTVCERYIADSVAKGSARSNQECKEAILIGFLDGYLEDSLRNNN